MQPEQIFSIANLLALAGWLALLASPWAPLIAQRVSGLAIPAILSVGYAAIVLAYWSSAEGGFSDLAGVSALFETPMILLAGWIHYLAFDLFVGAWEVRVARRETIPFLLVVPCLALTFLFGPAGFLAFSILRAARGGFAPEPETKN
jgi:hypothetical protein